MRKPKIWNTLLRVKVIEAYEKGELGIFYDDIVEWETKENGGIRPIPSLGAAEILEYYLSTKRK